MNQQMRDGILPSSLYDDPINNPTGAPSPIKLSTPAAAAAVQAPIGSAAAPKGAGKPGGGLSLIEEMKLRQANSKQRDVDASGNLVGNSGIKLAERKKSVVEPQRLVSLKPAAFADPSAKSDTSKVAPALAPKLNPVSKGPLPGPNPAAKYTTPVYSNLLRPTPRTERPEKPVQSFSKPQPSVAKPAPAPAKDAPKLEIEYLPGPHELLLPQTPPEEATLDDGTRIVKDKDGGFTQYNPNGVILREFADGSMKQTFPDGTILEISANGKKTTQTNPDGTRIEVENEVVTTCYPNGTIIQNLPNGEKHQTNPDGTIIHIYPDGKTVQTSIHDQVELTSYPDGSMDQLDKATGKKLHKKPDGTVQQIA